MRALPVSAMYTLPDESAASPCGAFSWAAVAAAPSPPEPTVPLPARVEMTPAAVTLRTTLLAVSAM